MRVTTEVAASDKLFTASATMATEEVSVPAITLPRNSSTLRKMACGAGDGAAAKPGGRSLGRAAPQTGTDQKVHS